MPEKIYNLDETANATVHTPDKIVVCKGIKQVGNVTSGERSPNVTSVACINAFGKNPTNVYIPQCSF
jgi:hypothetical protein